MNELAVIQILIRLYCNVDLGSHEPVTYLGSKVKPISTPTSHTQTSTQTSQDNIRHVCLARDWINFKCHDTSGMSHRVHGTFNLNFECSNLLLDMHSSIVWHCCWLTLIDLHSWGWYRFCDPCFFDCESMKCVVLRHCMLSGSQNGIFADTSFLVLFYKVLHPVVLPTTVLPTEVLHSSRWPCWQNILAWLHISCKILLIF